MAYTVMVHNSYGIDLLSVAFFEYIAFFYGIYSYGLYSHGLYSYGLHSRGPYTYGVGLLSVASLEYIAPFVIAHIVPPYKIMACRDIVMASTC